MTQLVSVDFASLGPAVGERLADIRLRDQRGRPIDLHADRGGRQALVVFHRSARWCPFCKTQLLELNRIFPTLEANGIALYAISYDSVEVLSSFAAKYGITFPLLSDEDSAVIKQLGVLNEQAAESVVGIPHPGLVLVDTAGRVHEKHFYPSYRERDGGSAVLEQLFGVQSPRHGIERGTETAAVRARAWLDSPTFSWGQRVWLTVELTIAEGHHIYGRPIPPGYRPVDIAVKPIDRVSVGEPSYPDSRPFSVEGLDEQFNVYECTVRARVPITFMIADTGELRIGVSVSYQACTSDDCLVPEQIELELPIIEVPLVERPPKG